MKEELFSSYARRLHDVIAAALASDREGAALDLESAIRTMGRSMKAAHQRGNRVFFVGNGGSAGIASHLATDFSKNGGMRASALNDGSVLTCLGNDYGYEHVFSKQLEWHARAGDVVVAISSSGKSANILAAAAAARAADCELFTFTGFAPDNPLRVMGDVNIYVSDPNYGFVEVGHLALLHGVLDIESGWRPDARASAA